MYAAGAGKVGDRNCTRASIATRISGQVKEEMRMMNSLKREEGRWFHLVFLKEIPRERIA